MRILVLLACITFWSVCRGQWSSPTTIYSSSRPIGNQWSFIDSFTNKVHIIFTMMIDNSYAFYYTSLSASGSTSYPKRLSNLFAANNRSDAVSIIGAHDGMHIYVVINAKRDDQADIFYIESYSDGVYFSDPIYARSNDLEDDYDRTMPSLAYTKSGRLILTYNKGGNLTYTMRAPYNIVWTNEKGWSMDPRILGNPMAVSSATGLLDDGKDYILIAALYRRRDSYAMVLLNSTTNGATWVYDVNTLVGNPNSIDIPIALSESTKSFFFASQRNSTFSGQRRAATIYERKGTLVEEYAVFPVALNILHSLKACITKGIPKIYSYVDSDDPQASNSVKMLLQFSEERPWEFIRMTPPSLGYNDWAVRIHCHNSGLYATGITSAYDIKGINYTAPNSLYQGRNRLS